MTATSPNPNPFPESPRARAPRVAAPALCPAATPLQPQRPLTRPRVLPLSRFLAAHLRAAPPHPRCLRSTSCPAFLQPAPAPCPLSSSRDPLPAQFRTRSSPGKEGGGNFSAAFLRGGAGFSSLYLRPAPPGVPGHRGGAALCAG